MVKFLRNKIQCDGKALSGKQKSLSPLQYGTEDSALPPKLPPVFKTNDHSMRFKGRKSSGSSPDAWKADGLRRCRRIPTITGSLCA